ncbi:MAG: hypothetical protein OSA89_18185 [Mariniblastus sp.]|nr:hypothetical protein [Mariniblastus sp.]
MNIDNPSDNPYTPQGEIPTSMLGPKHSPKDGPIRKVNVRPIELLSRSYQLIGNQYGLFLGISLVGILIGSMVPFGIVMGPMLIGIYLCFLHRQAGRQVEFGTLFKGFDQFSEGLIAYLIMVGFSIVASMVTVGLFVVIGLAAWALIAGTMEGDAAVGVGLGLAVLIYILFFVVLMVISVLINLPFVFAFQLIADRKLSGTEAIKQSWAGVKLNLGGIVWYMLVNYFLLMLAALACSIPAILLMPISLGGMFLLYSDIYRGE